MKPTRGLLCCALFAALIALVAVVAVTTQPQADASSRAAAQRIATVRGRHLPASGPGRGAHVGRPISRRAGSRLPKGREVLGRRTATSRTWRTPDGRYATRIWTAPINYRDAHGKWRRIDDTLEPASKPGVAFTNARNAYRVAFPSNLAASPIRVHTRAGVVAFRLRGGQGRPTAAGAHARFANVLPGVDANYVAGSDQLKEMLVLHSAKAAASYVYSLHLSRGLRARPTRDGAIAIVDRRGRAHYAFRAPVAYDSAGAQIGTGRGISLRLVRSHGRLGMRLAVDPTWLHAANRRYPVTLDPGLNVSDDQDCYILGGSWTNVNGCGNPELLVGWNGATPYRTMLHFDVQTALPSKSQVLGANAMLYLNAEDATTATTVEAHKLTQSWTAGATWNKFDGTNLWTHAGGDFDSTPAYTCQNAAGTTGVWDHFSIANLVQDWEDGTTPNYGILLKEPSETVQNTLHFTSKWGTSTQAPYLQVDWEPKYRGDQSWYPLARTPLSDRQSIAVNAASGALLGESTDMQIAGVGVPVRIQRTLNGQSPDMNEFGYAQMLGGGFDMYLDLYGDGASFVDATGTPFHFTQNSNGTYNDPPGINAKLVHNGDGTYTLTYNKSGTKLNFSSDGSKLTSIKDKNDRTLTFNYLADGRVDTIKDAENRTVTFSYDTTTWAHVVNKITDSTGRHVDYTYTPGHQLQTFTDGAGKTTTYGYDANGNVSQITDGAGNITVIGYDGSKRVTSIKRVTNNSTMAGDTTTFTYNADNTVVTDPRGNNTTYFYDTKGRQTKVTDGLNHSQSQTWDDNNLPLNFTSGVNQSTGKSDQNQYDANRNLQKNIGPDNTVNGQNQTGPTTTWSYNLSGNHPYFPDSATNPQNLTTNFHYDSSTSSAPNVSSIDINGGAAEVTYNYNNTIKGQIDSSTDSKTTGVTHYTYETIAPYASGGGDLKTIQPPSPQGTTTLTHDGLSRIATVKDGLLQTTTYHYDGDDRVSSIDYPNGTTVSYTYDGDGNITQVSDSNGLQSETYVYDHKNRLTSDSGATGNDTYTYDAADNLATVTDGGGTVTYAYDAANNACWVFVGTSSNGCATAPTGATKFDYNEDNRRKATHYPGSVDMTTTWDNDDRITEIKALKSGVLTPLTDFKYDFVNANVTPKRDESVRQSVLDTVTNNKTTYSYDTKGRLLQAQTKNQGGSGSVVSDVGYVYDANGNRCFNNSTDPGTGATCTSPPSAVTKTWHYDTANELCWSLGSVSTASTCTAPTGATTFAYDADGQETSESGRGSLSWNSRHQATSVFGTSMTYFGGDNSLRLTSGTASFKYNALGLGTKTVSGTSAYYTRDPNGQLVSDRTGSGTYYYLFDGLGSVVALTDSTGSVAQRYSYTPWGIVTPTGSVDNPWQFASGYYESGPATVKFGQRYYDPGNGRWTQPDPIDAVGIQSANRYMYAHDNPVNIIDPSGEYSPGGDLCALKDTTGTQAQYTQCVQGSPYVDSHRGSGLSLSGSDVGCTVAGGAAGLAATATGAGAVFSTVIGGAVSIACAAVT
jgi:RHS repeat-associated protein